MEGFAAAYAKRGAGVTTLEALAWKTQVRDAVIAPTIDARRGEVYGALYSRPVGQTADTATDSLVEERPPVVLKPAEWFASLPRRPLIFCGDGAIRYRAWIAENPEWSIHPTDLYLASTVAEMALAARCGPLSPLYVRKTDAEIARESIGSPNS
jgi:tRNA A37 threonylcarbamoyladenosine modification protein TsaB